MFPNKNKEIKNSEKKEVPVFEKSFYNMLAGRTFTRIGGSLFALFFPIFLYEKYSSISIALGFFVLATLLFGILAPISGKLLARLGTRKMLAFATINLSLFSLCVAFFDYAPNIFLLLIVLFQLLFRLTFWIPYAIELTDATHAKSRGRAMALIFNILAIVDALGALIAGLVITYFDYWVLGLITLVFYTIATFYFLRIKDIRTEYSWEKGERLRQFLKKENRAELVSFFARGAESAIARRVWPLFIFILFSGSHSKTGYISSAVMVLVLFLNYFIGKYIDRVKEHLSKVVVWGSFFTAFGWVLKIFAVTTFHVFAIDIYHKISKSFLNMSFDTKNIDITEEQEEYLDEFTVMRTTASQFGRALALSAVILIAHFYTLSLAFIIAAFASLAISSIYNYQPHKYSPVGV